jgi:hypothetical protein
VAGLAIASGYVSSGTVTTWEATGYAFVAFAAVFVGVTAVLGVGLAMLSLLPGAASVLRWLAPAVAAALLAFLWVDSAAFATYRFHVGGLAWTALRFPGGLAELGIWPPSPPLLLAAVVLVAVLDGLVLRRMEARAAVRPRRAGWAWLVGAAAFAVAAERTWFLAAESAGRRDVVRAAYLVPFYPVLMSADLAETLPSLASAGRGATGAVPANAVAFAADAPRWNVLWIILDSWRADAMTPALTPTATALARRSTVFRQHLTGGNATRYGLVSMLYGLPAAAWSRLQIEGRSPPLLATLRARGWRLGVFTSVDMPDILSVVFADVPPESRIAVPPARAAEKDLATIAALEAFLAAPDDGRPFFAFVHLISTHGPYDPSCRLPRAARGHRPRYERAIRCADRLVARALRRVSLANTIVILTADHGEAFGEHGVFGHASGFTRPQLDVPLVLHVPGRAPAEVTRPTSHHDVAATILDALGGSAPSPVTGIGRPLLAGDEASPLFACNLNECAIHDAEGSVTFGIGARYPRELAIRDAAGAEVPTDGDLGRRRFAQVLEFLGVLRRAMP